MIKKLKNCYVWAEDGVFTNKGEIINYTKWHLNVNGIDIDIAIDKAQLKIFKQLPDLFQFDEIDGIKVE